MAKITAWIVTLIGILLILRLIPGLEETFTQTWVAWVIALAVLGIGVTKLIRNYKTN